MLFCQSSSIALSSPQHSSFCKMRIFPCRLRPGNDVRKSLETLVARCNIKAGIILTSVGSLSKVVVRLSNDKVKTFSGNFEILSLAGTLSVEGAHLHICFSDKEGKAFGGHLKPGSIVYTTAEIVIGDIENCVFRRKPDQKTGFDELEFQ